MKNKNVYIIAGPNGSGKTTFAKKFLPDYAKCPNFINADFIAQGLSPFSPRAAAIKAGRLVLGEIHNLADTWLLFNNADVTPRLIAREKDGKTEIIDKVLFEKIIKE